MDILNNVWESTKKLLFSVKEPPRPPIEEHTAAPYNVFPIDFGITEKVKEETKLTSPWDSTSIPPSIEKIINDIMSRFHESEPNISGSEGNYVLGGSILISDNNRNSAQQPPVHKVVDEITSQAAEVIKEVVSTDSTTIRKDKFESESSMADIYIVAILGLVLALIFLIGGLLWCRKNKIKTEKRNSYPVIAVDNKEYVNKQELKNNLKQLP